MKVVADNGPSVVPFKRKDQEGISVLDLLKELVAKVEKGDYPADGVFIGLTVPNPDGTCSFPYFTAGLTPLELRGLISLYQVELP